MTLCKFFLQGNCRFGSDCRFEHRAPRPNESEYNEWRRNNPTSFGGQNTFGASNPDDNHATRKGWSEQIIYDNLKNEHPAWPFTSFGAPYFRSLIQGDLSFDEYHLAAMEANRNGTFANWQRECDQRVAEIEKQEENVLRNLTQAWKYNVNDPYYPSGRLESESSTGSGSAAAPLGGRQIGTFGGTSGASAFGSSQSAFGGASSLAKPPSSFGSSPFGTMPASAFTLGSRSVTSNPQSTFGNTPSAFGNTTSNTTFGQPQSAFGTTTSTLSTFGTGTSSAFGAKPSAFGTTSNLPPAPLSTGLSAQPTFGQTSTLGSGLSSQPTFGQTSTLGASGLPPPPGIGMASRPAFGQPSALGAIGGTSTPAFGQASAFSSPFSSGLGRALGGGTTTGTFGSKSTFGSFGQNNQPNAFAQAAGTGQQNAFVQAAGRQSAFMQAASQPSAFAAAATTGTNAFSSDQNRFTMLTESNEITTAGDKDDDMADEITPVQEKPPAFATQSVPIVPVAPTPPQPEIPPPPRAPSNQFPNIGASSLSAAFGSLSTESGQKDLPEERSTVTQKPPEPPKPVRPILAASVSATPGPSRSIATERKPIIDEMAAWRANEFVIGGIPETEPPLEVR